MKNRIAKIAVMALAGSVMIYGGNVTAEEIEIENAAEYVEEIGEDEEPELIEALVEKGSCETEEDETMIIDEEEEIKNGDLIIEEAEIIEEETFAEENFEEEILEDTSFEEEYFEEIPFETETAEEPVFEEGNLEETDALAEENFEEPVFAEDTAEEEFLEEDYFEEESFKEDLITIEDYDTPLGLGYTREEMEEAAREQQEEQIDPENMKVTIFTSMQDGTLPGEQVTLTSQIEGFENVNGMAYQWMADKGYGFEPVSGANDNSYTFTADEENMGWNWRLMVYFC